jgi:membrane-associated phospholipid phosphatase
LIFAYVPRAVAFKPLTWLVRAFCVFEMALIGPARMYTAAHWFSDVIGAALLAGIYLALAWKIDGAIKHLRAVAVERDLAADAGLSVQPRGKRRFGRTPRPTSPAVAAERATREPEPITRS